MGYSTNTSEFHYEVSQFPSKEIVSDLLYDVDLSVERALEKIDSRSRHNYKAMYEWFISNTESGNDIGSREYGRGQRIPGVDSDFAHAAQRGIHVPSRQTYAATITITRRSLYGQAGLDGNLVELGDGTWLLNYAAHRNNTDGETISTWNDGLLRCCYDGVPVGVFIERESGNYFRALAFVESFDPNAGTFLLHGPVTSTNAMEFCAPSKTDAAFAGIVPDIKALQADQRTLVEQFEYKRQGQEKFKRQLMKAYDGHCAVCDCGVGKTLQAAHILPYRGTQSNIVSNGLLLRADIHILYDKALLSVEPESHRVVLSPELEGTEYESLDGKTIALPSKAALHPSDDLLALNHARFCKALAV